MTEPLDVSPLFEPFAIDGLALPNRFIVPGMQRGWCDHGVPSPRLAEYYRRRIKGGVSLIITEACAIDHPASTQGPSFGRLVDRALSAWAECVRAVHDAHGKLFVQLWHEGAVRKEGGDGPYAHVRTLSPSGLLQGGRQNGCAATPKDLEEIKEAFVRGALAARSIGADGVEIHACHGYLLDQFLWADTNRRTDGLGGDSIAARARFPAEVVAAVRGAVGPGFPISFRMSQWKEIDFKARVVQTPQELQILVDAIVSAGVSMFHVSTRRFFEPEWSGSPLGFAGWTKRLGGVPVIAVGSVGLDRDVMESFGGQEAQSRIEGGLRELVRRVRDHEFDLIAIGRSSIADPDFVLKVRQGRLGEIRTFRIEHLQLEEFTEHTVDGFREQSKSAGADSDPGH